MALNAVSSGSATLLTFLTSPKLLLGLLSLVFDVIFLVQHYILYAGDESGTGGETRALLSSLEQQGQGQGQGPAQNDRLKNQRAQQRSREWQDDAMERGNEGYGSAACCEETVVNGFGSRGDAWD